MRPLSGRSTAACGVPKADIAHGVAKRKPITSAYMFESHPVRHFGKNRERRFPPTFLLWWLPASSTGCFCCLDVDRVVRDLDVLGEGADMFPPIAALSKPEASASFACQFRHGRFGVTLNSNSKAPDGLHRALLSQVTSRLLGSEDFEIVGVCHHTVVPST